MQAYTLELEAEVAKLREMNQEFRKKQVRPLGQSNYSLQDDTGNSQF